MADNLIHSLNALGLCSGNGNPVPLKSIKVDVLVKGYIADVTANLSYFNDEESPVNAVYTFPVDDSCAVYNFEADIDGNHIVAKIQTKEKAELTYQDAVDKGKTAVLLEEDSSAGDTFCCKLGNLPANTEALLTLKCVMELPQESDGKLRFTLPTVLNPRYSPDFGQEVAADGATYVPPSKVKYSFDLKMKVQGYFRVRSVTSDKIQIRVDLLENQKIAEVSLDEEFKFDHDLCCLIEYETSFEPQVILEPGIPDADGMLKQDMLMISFHPDLKEIAMASCGEFIFVIDRSGSMTGEKIHDAKEALLLFLKSLPPNSYFNVVSFGSHYKLLFSSESKPYSEKTLKKGLELCEKMNADMGGTEILQPLKQVFKQKQIQGHPKSVFVLTDGQVSNTEAVLTLVKKNSESTGTRVFSVGIGEGASTSLVKGIAFNGNGKAEFISSGARIQPKVVSLLKCAMQPAITEVAIHWNLPPDVNPTMIPEAPSLITAGERLTLFVVLDGVDIYTVYAPSTVTVSGKQNDRPISFCMSFTLSEDEEPQTSAPVHRLATKRNIQLLQTEESALYSVEYYSHDLVNKAEQIRDKIVNLSIHGNVISKFTAFVAVNEGGKTVETEAIDRSCPVPTLSKEFVDVCTRSSLRCCGLFDEGLSDVYSSAPLSYRSNLMSDCLSDRDEKLDSLMEQSEQLHSASSPFYKTKRKSSFVGKIFGGGGLFSRRSKSARSKSAKSSKPMPSSSVTRSSANEYDCLDTADDVDECDSSEDLCTRVDEHEGTTLSKAQANDLPPVPPPTVKFSSGDDMLNVISMQEIDGQWKQSQSLLKLLDVTKEHVDKLKYSTDMDVIYTVLAVSWLRYHYPGRQEEWQMIEAKALAWLSKSDINSSIEENITLTIDTIWKK
ncbi:von Willebrand factor A domain-containing protein 5A [Mactra antiquata]